MSKIDKLKEEIGWLKIIFSIFVASDLSLLVWIFQNSPSQRGVFLGVGIIALVLMTGGIIWINRIAYKKIDELEEL